jgi:hypothetical protein
MAMASARTRATNVTSPPAVIRPGERLKLQIRGSRKPVLYLSHESRHDRTSVRVSARVHLRGGRGTAVLTIPP